MKKLICFVLCVVMIFALAACSKAKPADNAKEESKEATQTESTEETAQETSQTEETAKEWTREGYFLDENQNMVSITWMEDTTDKGWYVGCMLGENLEDSWGGLVPQEGNALHGEIPSAGENDPITITVTEEGEDGLQLVVEGGETYHFKVYEMPKATIFVTINTEGQGNIEYAEGEEAPEIDPEYPFQSAVINLAEPTTHTFVAWPQEGNKFVKWTKNGEDFSTEPVITLLLDESADYIAVFEEE